MVDFGRRRGYNARYGRQCDPTAMNDSKGWVLRVRTQTVGWEDERKTTEDDTMDGVDSIIEGRWTHGWRSLRDYELKWEGRVPGCGRWLESPKRSRKKRGVRQPSIAFGLRSGTQEQEGEQLLASLASVFSNDLAFSDPIPIWGTSQTHTPSDSVTYIQCVNLPPILSHPFLQWRFKESCDIVHSVIERSARHCRRCRWNCFKKNKNTRRAWSELVCFCLAEPLNSRVYIVSSLCRQVSLALWKPVEH